MRGQEQIYRMNDSELRKFRRILRLRRERRRKMLITTLSMLAVTCAIIFGAGIYPSIRTNAGNGFKYYTSVVIEPGETLWNLADEYIDYNHYKDKNKYVAEVQRINHLDSDYTIYAGQMLIVPYYSDEYIR